MIYQRVREIEEEEEEEKTKKNEKEKGKEKAEEKAEEKGEEKAEKKAEGKGEEKEDKKGRGKQVRNEGDEEKTNKQNEQRSWGHLALQTLGLRTTSSSMMESVEQNNNAPDLPVSEDQSQRTISRNSRIIPKVQRFFRASQAK